MVEPVLAATLAGALAVQVVRVQAQLYLLVVLVVLDFQVVRFITAAEAAALGLLQGLLPRAQVPAMVAMD